MNITSFWELFIATFAGLPTTANAGLPPLFSNSSQSTGTPLLSGGDMMPTVTAAGLVDPYQQILRQPTKLSGIGLVPSLLGGLLGSMLGHTDPVAASPQPFSLPSALNLETGFSARSGRTGLVDYSANSQPRLADQQQLAGAPSIVIQIQALDSRSILDRSQEIASAVREAVLNAHPLGTLLRE